MHRFCGFHLRGEPSEPYENARGRGTTHGVQMARCWGKLAALLSLAQNAFA